MFKLTTENLGVLAHPGMLREAATWSYIPQTIRDAIDLVQQLRERYLWVDSMCLVQDDKADLESGIVTMDLVYEHALLTIIAGAGSHAHFGLPGVSKNSRIVKQRVVEVKPGLHLTSLRSVSKCLESSEYGNRAWT
jgi:hypothetical protein